MPGPDLWLQDIVVNDGDGNPREARVVQLGNGNLLVAWTAQAGTSGQDIIGRLVDPMGRPLGEYFRLNGSHTVGQQTDGQLLALPDGGFILIYEDNALGGSIRLDRYAADGGIVAVDHELASGYAPTGPTYLNPRVVLGQSGEAFIAYERNIGGSATLVGKIYNPETDSYSDEIALIDRGSGAYLFGSAIVALDNGSYVVAVPVEGGGEINVYYRIIDASGQEVMPTMAVSSLPTSLADYQPSLAALDGGTFVMAWAVDEGSRIHTQWRIYDSNGGALAEGIAGQQVASVANSRPIVRTFDDGSFAIIYETNDGTLYVVERFNDAGVSLGFTRITEDSLSNMTGATLGDGRLAAVWSTNGGDVEMSILDPRSAIDGDLAAGPGGWQIGTIYGDRFTTTVDTITAHGYKGDDTITAAGGESLRLVSGDEGDDLIIVRRGSAATHFDGGDGSDMIDWSTYGIAGIWFHLEAGTASLTFASIAMTGFEHLAGTGAADLITGTTGANRLYGNSGTDWIEGVDGDDLLDGGLGDDTLSGGAGNDVYYATAGDLILESAARGLDRVFAESSFVLNANIEILTLTGTGNFTGTGNGLGNVLTGNSGSNALYGLDGNDRLIGLAGADTLIGGRGDDVFIVEGMKDLVVERAGQGFDTIISDGSFSIWTLNSIERLEFAGAVPGFLRGNSNGNTLIGNTGSNTINGFDGNDTILGHGGRDTITGGMGQDTIAPGLERDTVLWDGVAESTGATRDIVSEFIFSSGGAYERLDFSFVPTAVAATITTGSLSEASFNADLQASVTVARLGVSEAVLFDPNGSDLNVGGHIYLVVDANGQAGYQANEDYVVQFAGTYGTLTVDNFV